MARMDAVHSLAFSNDGRMLAAGGKALRLWRVGTGQELVTLREQGTVLGVAFSPDGKWLAAAPGCYTDGPVAVEIWDVAARRLRARLRGHGSGHVRFVSFAPDGNTLAVEDLTTVRLWNLSSLRKTTDRKVTEFCEANPEFEIVGPVVERVQVTSLSSRAQIASVGFSPDGKTLASWSVDKEVKLWDVMTGEELTTLTAQSAEPEFFCAHSVAFSPDGKMLAAASGNLIRLWGLEDYPRPSLSRLPAAKKVATEVGKVGSEPFSLDGMAYVSCAVYSPDGRMLAAGATASGRFPRAGIARVWDVATGRTLKTLRHPGVVKTVGGFESSSDNGIRSLAFSPEGTTLVVAPIWARRFGT
jgi:WD40 repeat protein